MVSWGDCLPISPNRKVYPWTLLDYTLSNVGQLRWCMVCGRHMQWWIHDTFSNTYYHLWVSRWPPGAVTRSLLQGFCRRSTGIWAHLARRARQWLSHIEADDPSQWMHLHFIPKILYMVTDGWFRWLFHLFNVLLLKIYGDYPYVVRWCVFILITEIVPEVLSIKWHQHFSQNVPVQHPVHVSFWIDEVAFYTIVESIAHMNRTTTSLNQTFFFRKVRGVLLQVTDTLSFTHERDGHEIETHKRRVDMLPVDHSQVPVPLYPLKTEPAVFCNQQGPSHPTGKLTMGHKYTVDRLAHNPHFILIPHPLFPGVGSFEAAAHIF